MRIEVCVDNLESANNAITNGADELEVCGNLSVGGLTPSYNLVLNIIQMIDRYVESYRTPRPKVNIMIRSTSNPRFTFNETQLLNMKYDVLRFKRLNIDRFVFGALTIEDSGATSVDHFACEEIIAAAAPKPVTFHRAFDVHNTDPSATTIYLRMLGFDRILTSGHRRSAADPRAVELLKSLIEKHNQFIEIMPGAGINDENAKTFLDMGCTIIHGSFRKNPKDSTDYVTNGDIVKKIRELIDGRSKN